MPSTAKSFGTVYIEACSYVEPAFDDPAPVGQEPIEEGVTGLIINEQRADAVVTALLLLLAASQLRRCLGAVGW